MMAAHLANPRLLAQQQSYARQRMPAQRLRAIGSGRTIITNGRPPPTSAGPAAHPGGPVAACWGGTRSPVSRSIARVIGVRA